MRRALHAIWRVVKPLGAAVIALVILAAAVLIPVLSGSVGEVKDNLQVAPNSTPTTGPLSGDQSAIPSEVSCMKKYAADPANNYVNYPPAIGAPEHTDSTHTGVNPCATFTGSFKGDNEVFQYQSQSTFEGGIQFNVFDGPSGGYLQAGGLGPPGQYAAKFDPSSGEQIWSTPLANVNVTPGFIAAGSMAVLEDGSIANAAGNTIWRLDPDTGDILASEKQPILAGGAKNANFDGFHVAPDAQGTILLKSQNRPPGCPTQGNAALSSCVDKYGQRPDSTVIAADPKTLENLDAIKLDQSVLARPIVTKHHGTIYLYVAGDKTIIRVIWDPETQKLTQDKSWAPKYLIKGQTGGTAPGLIGDWVIQNQNGSPSDTTPQCVVAVNQDDPNDLHRVCPWGKTLPDGVSSSETPGSLGTDPENSMIYIQDWFVNGVYGVRLDQKTGDLKTAWSRPDWRTSDYFSLVGPPDKRVLISQYLEPGWQKSDLPGYNYTEAVEWANAATGKTIARSDYNPSTVVGSLINLGYGGRIYSMGNNGSVYIYQLEPKSSG